MRKLNVLVFILYPLVVHVALSTDEELIALVMLMLTSALHFISSFREKPISYVASLIPLLIFILAISNVYTQDMIALYLPPLLISGSLFLVFSRSLLSTNEPVITRIARIIFKENDPEILGYTRQVTQLWNLFFALIFIESALLALFAPIEIWSIFTNILNYLFIVIVFTLEYLYRRFRFANKPRRKIQWSGMLSVNWSSLIRNSDHADTRFTS